jgi:hypothetical protein
VTKLTSPVAAAREDPAVPPEGEAVKQSSSQAPHPNLGESGHGCWSGEDYILVLDCGFTVAHCGTFAARQKLTGRIQK